MKRSSFHILTNMTEAYQCASVIYFEGILMNMKALVDCLSDDELDQLGFLIQVTTRNRRTKYQELTSTMGQPLDSEMELYKVNRIKGIKAYKDRTKHFLGDCIKLMDFVCR